MAGEEKIDLTPPEDLVALKVAWLEAFEQEKAICREEPAGEVKEVPGLLRDEPPRALTLASEDQTDRVEAARARLRELTLAIYRHPWKADPPGGMRLEAEAALNEAAEARHRAAPAR